MKIFAISDLHLSINSPKPMDIFGPVWSNYLDQIISSWNEKVSEEDIVLIAGDISWAMILSDAKKDLDFISNLKGKKIIIRGNHDYWWKSITQVRNILPQNMFAIQNDCLNIGDFVFCGSRGWQVPEKTFNNLEDKKIFDRELIRMELSLSSADKKFPNLEKYVLIHYPPFNSKYEDSEFTKLFEKYNVKKVIYGHLHGRDCRSQKLIVKNGIEYHLTSCDLVNNNLVLIEG